MLKWLAGDDAQIAIFDASNVTIQRRAKLREKVNAAGGGISIVFLESICTNEEVIRGMKMWKVRNSPDFVTMSEADALKDLEQRIELRVGHLHGLGGSGGSGGSGCWSSAGSVRRRQGGGSGW